MTHNLESLRGETITVFAMNYFYSGKLVEIDSQCIKLADCVKVYDTGDLISDTGWKDFKVKSRNLGDVFVMISAIESFLVLK